MLPPDSLQPIQGSLPCGKLDAQPPLQLLATFSRLASPSLNPVHTKASVRLTMTFERLTQSGAMMPRCLPPAAAPVASSIASVHRP